MPGGTGAYAYGVPKNEIQDFFSEPLEEKIAHWLTRHGMVWYFGQNWNPCPEVNFAPGRVFLGRDGAELLVLADLYDTCTTTDRFEFNEPAFRTCDAFEMFLGPNQTADYYELHVTPSNSVLQLYFENSESRKSLHEHTVEQPLFLSSTCKTTKGWRVLARVPLEKLFGPQQLWRLSFGRYDHTPGTAPVISSTSPHTKCHFHCKPEWRTLEWQRCPAIGEL